MSAALPGFRHRVLPGETDGAHPSAWNGFSSLPVTAVVKVQEEAGSLLTFQTPRRTSSFHQTRPPRAAGGPATNPHRETLCGSPMEGGAQGCGHW